MYLVTFTYPKIHLGTYLKRFFSFGQALQGVHYLAGLAGIIKRN
jgi:hypothetical protein